MKDRIVSAALRVFAERGFHRATIQDVVRESGLSVGAIYTHFAGKDELFLATCDVIGGQGLGELGRRLAVGGSAAERLAIAVSFFVDSVLDPPDGSTTASYLVQAWAEADQEPGVREMLVRRREQLSTAARLLLEEGIARGELSGWLDVEAVASACTALLDGLVLQRMEEGAAFRRAAHERRARTIVELLVAAAAAPTRPALPAVLAEPFDLLPPAPSTARAS
ncbi:MAG TPA: TetR/AcrR family transcriptional regulator [Candidatus Limnocylindrales bacterium]|nr:TetR/AcrR family transcriptional regulator [Candidatus Limnocylindrales bacterium]